MNVLLMEVICADFRGFFYFPAINDHLCELLLIAYFEVIFVFSHRITSLWLSCVKKNKQIDKKLFDLL